MVQVAAYDRAGNQVAIGSCPDSARKVGSAWQYDAAGNRELETRNGITTHYEYSQQNQLTYTWQENTSLSGVLYNYDDNRNLTDRTAESDGVAWSFSYDNNDRLTMVQKGSQTLATYAYDAFGRRVRSAQVTGASCGTLSISVYSGLGVIYEETFTFDPTVCSPEVAVSLDLSSPLLTPTGSVDYVRGNGQLLAKQDSAGVMTYYHLDHLGSTRAVTNSDGEVVGRFDYEPFGRRLPEGVGSELFAFTGQRDDSVGVFDQAYQTGLYYYGARFYDPAIGRFITQDPAQDGLNWYAYCNNNPIGCVDPTGRSAMTLNRPEALIVGLGLSFLATPLASLRDLMFPEYRKFGGQTTPQWFGSITDIQPPMKGPNKKWWPLIPIGVLVGEAAKYAAESGSPVMVDLEVWGTMLFDSVPMSGSRRQELYDALSADFLRSYAVQENTAALVRNYNERVVVERETQERLEYQNSEVGRWSAIQNMIDSGAAYQ